MPIIAVGFDIGHTLIDYNSPLSWKSLYPDALRKIMEVCRLGKQEELLDSAIAILSKYNTREHYREYEVSSDTIFREIFDAWGQDYGKLSDAKKVFYGFTLAEKKNGVNPTGKKMTNGGGGQFGTVFHILLNGISHAFADRRNITDDKLTEDQNEDQIQDDPPQFFYATKSKNKR